MPSDLVSRLVQAGSAGGGTSALVQLAPAAPKRRAAVVAHDAFYALDTYHAAKPALFLGGLAGVVGCGVALYARRRRGAEAWGVWALGMLVSGGVAWVTRPGARPTPAALPTTPTGSQGTAPALAAVNAWLDQRAAALDRSEPGWQDKALQRLLG